MRPANRAQRISIARKALALTTAVGLSAALGSAAGASAVPAAGAAHDGPAAVPNELLVGYAAGATPTQRAVALQRAGVQLEKRVVTAASDRVEVQLVRTPPGADRAAVARDLEADPAVAYAEPNWTYTVDATSNDPYYTNGSLWGMTGGNGTAADAAWGAGHTGSSSVYVGVIDEGIQYTHPDLAANVWTNPFDSADGVDNDGNGYVDDVHGWDFANNDNTVYDGGSRGNLDNHGTHVSGTIGGRGGNGLGVAGVNWNVTLISGKFLGRRGGTTANAVKAVDYFTTLKRDHGLNIVATNNSWGGGGFSKALFDAIGRANAQDILFVAAAGNGGSDQVGDDNDTVDNYPSNYDQPNVIAVAAITSTGARASFSNYGATTVDLGAPGAGIYSTLAGSTYGSYSGTSMATPHVTGAAALYASTHPSASAAGIKSAILSNVVATSSLAGKTVTGGRLNVSGF
ncbi:MAG TPA: S8 family peptidase [Acidimicrobiales bacterium]|nr:S8 family peptidase [Acidimicrobiales bacterium]